MCNILGCLVCMCVFVYLCMFFSLHPYGNHENDYSINFSYFDRSFSFRMPADCYKTCAWHFIQPKNCGNLTEICVTFIVIAVHLRIIDGSTTFFSSKGISLHFKKDHVHISVKTIIHLQN